MELTSESSGLGAPAAGPAAIVRATPIRYDDDDLAVVKFDDNGLVPAIVQDAGDGAVLMLGYMDDGGAAPHPRHAAGPGSGAAAARSTGARARRRATGSGCGPSHYDCDGDALLVRGGPGRARRVPHRGAELLLPLLRRRRPAPMTARRVERRRRGDGLQPGSDAFRAAGPARTGSSRSGASWWPTRSRRSPPSCAWWATSPDSCSSRSRVVSAGAATRSSAAARWPPSWRGAATSTATGDAGAPRRRRRRRRGPRAPSRRCSARSGRPALPDLPPLHGGLVGYLGYDVVREVEHLPDVPPDDLGVPRRRRWPSSASCAPSTIGASAPSSSTTWSSTRRGATPSAAPPTTRPTGRLDEFADDLRRPAGRAPLRGAGARRRRCPTVRRTMSTPGLRRRGGGGQGAHPRRRRLPGGALPALRLRPRGRPLRRLPGPAPGEPEPVPLLPAHRRVHGGGLVARAHGAAARRRRRVAADRRHPARGAGRGRGPAAWRPSSSSTRRRWPSTSCWWTWPATTSGGWCEFGTEHVDELMTVERYSHVMHLTSQVTGRLAPGKGPIDVLRATLPAGTLSGAPKVRAMQIIDDLEPTKRGVYGGVVGYLDFSGNLDTAIAIRTMVVAPDGRAFVQAGAGIVADSVPEDEDAECAHKAAALLAAVPAARRATAARRPEAGGCVPVGRPATPSAVSDERRVAGDYRTLRHGVAAPCDSSATSSPFRAPTPWSTSRASAARTWPPWPMGPASTPCVLSPQGKIDALVRVTRRGPDEFVARRRRRLRRRGWRSASSASSCGSRWRSSPSRGAAWPCGARAPRPPRRPGRRRRRPAGACPSPGAAWSGVDLLGPVARIRRRGAGRARPRRGRRCGSRRGSPHGGRDRRTDDRGRGRARRPLRQLHQGLLHRPGARGPTRRPGEQGGPSPARPGVRRRDRGAVGPGRRSSG